MNPFGYIGIPFLEYGRDRNGADCWGLVKIVLGDNGIKVPSYTNVSVNNNEAIQEAIKAGMFSQYWRRVEKPEFLDVVVMRSVVKIGDRFMSAPVHVGIMIDGLRVLHTEEKIGVSCHRVSNPKISQRLVGYYRHHSLG